MSGSVELKKELIEVMQKESLLLDDILAKQSELHQCVKSKDWDLLNKNIEALQVFGDEFTVLDSRRDELSAKLDVYGDPECSEYMVQVRGKLQRSKVENNVLNEYIRTTRKFLQGVFDSVVPQRRNTLYSKNGNLVKPELSSLVVNQIV